MIFLFLFSSLISHCWMYSFLYVLFLMLRHTSASWIHLLYYTWAISFIHIIFVHFALFFPDSLEWPYSSQNLKIHRFWYLNIHLCSWIWLHGTSGMNISLLLFSAHVMILFFASFPFSLKYKFGSTWLILFSCSVC